MRAELAARIAAREAILSKLRDVLIDRMRLARTHDEIDPDAPLFGAGFGLDSLDAVELVVALENSFGVKIADNRLVRQQMRTLNTLADLVLAYRDGRHGDAAHATPDLSGEIAAIRTSVALGDGAHIACVRITGADAQELVDRISPRELFVRAGQMLHTLLLDDDGAPVADLYLCCDEEDYYLLAEGLDGPALAACAAAAAGGLDAAVIDQSESHAILTLDGPYAWELLAEVASPDVIGLPYLGFFHEGRFTCFRGGKTGEYGYDLLVPRAQRAELREVLLEAGRRFELREASLAALDLCRLEAGFFNVRREVRPGLTPVELQQQWRLTASRAFRGAAAVAAHRREPRGRVTMITAASEIRTDAAIELDGERVGSVLHAGPSHTRGDWIGLAHLPRALAHAGLAGFTCSGAPVRTASAPAVNNRSLFVDPQRHAWATRDRESFPPLVRPL